MKKQFIWSCPRLQFERKIKKLLRIQRRNLLGSRFFDTVSWQKKRHSSAKFSTCRSEGGRNLLRNTYSTFPYPIILFQQKKYKRWEKIYKATDGYSLEKLSLVSPRCRVQLRSVLHCKIQISEQQFPS